MNSHPLYTHQRQIHLDFHTSPFIPDVSMEFDAEDFAKTMESAHVNSVTIFAKCHHGQCYYPTKTGVQHPALKGRDLLGEMIEALHRRGIRAPIYTTVGWEEDVAAKHPEWRQMRADGTFARCGNADPSLPPHPGGWHYNNFLHPDYQDYIEAHVLEILSNYPADGLFFDILLFDPQSCWSESSLRFREQHGLMAHDSATQARFECLAQTAFARRFTKLIHDRNSAITVFYNSTNPIYIDATTGVRTRHSLQTHWELESLPSGFWGYQHFPRLARSLGNWGKPWLGMTGRFQKMWGDFGGLKPQAALEFECFRTQAMGGANSVGDQLPPRGRLDAGAYRLIGSVYKQCEAAESFYLGSKAIFDIGILTPNAADGESAACDKSLEGVVQMCEESHYDAAVLDDASPLDDYRLLILPDSVSVTPALKRSLDLYLARGGKIIFSSVSAFTREGTCELADIKLKCVGPVTLYPTYWRACESFSPDLALSDRVVYASGHNVEAGSDVEVWVERVLPYFRRTDLTFSSHFQTPPQANSDKYAAVLGGANFCYFADPIFREYRQSGNIAVRDGWRAAMQRLIGAPHFGSGLPTTMLTIPRRSGPDLLLTLLHYIPTRKALDIDMIEERSSFAGETLRLSKPAQVIDFETNLPLPVRDDGSILLPAKKGRLLLRVPNYFQ